MLRNVLLGSAAAILISGSALAAPADSWTGFYAGAQVGGGWSQSNLSGYDFDPATSIKPKWSAVTGGVHAGYDKQFGQFVAGFEAELNARSGTKDYTFHYNADAINGGWESKSSYDANLRGRFGYLVTPLALLYGTVGVTFQDFTFDNPTCIGCANWDAENLYGGGRIGWTIGAGAQYAFTNHWSANVDYRHSDYGTVTTPTSSGGPSNVTDKAKLDDNSVTFGVSYKFGG